MLNILKIIGIFLVGFITVILVWTITVCFSALSLNLAEISTPESRVIVTIISVFFGVLLAIYKLLNIYCDYMDK